MNFQKFKLDLEKAEEPEIKLPNIHWITEIVREFQKNKKSTSGLLTMPIPLTVWITTNYGKFFKKRQYQTT